MKIKKYKRTGVIGTIVFHILLLVVFIFLGLKYEVPPPEEQGVEVNLGFSDQGMGDTKSLVPASEESSASAPSETNKNVITQNTEEAPNIFKLKPKNQQNKPPEETKPAIDENALYKPNTNKGENEGITGKPGNQGNPNGDPNSKNYVGTPGSGGGISFSLRDRTSRSLPKPVYNIPEEGKVVVTIWVNKKGQVTNAIAGAKGTTTSNLKLRNLAVKAAMKAKFSVNPDAPEIQKGTITYNFIRLK